MVKKLAPDSRTHMQYSRGSVSYLLISAILFIGPKSSAKLAEILVNREPKCRPIQPKC